MKKILTLSLFGILFLSVVHAGNPLWTFTPVPNFPPQVNVTATGNAVVKYTVTNQSRLSHTLRMRPIRGITAQGCDSVLASHQSCTLMLNISGSLLQGDIIGGPIFCSMGNPNQCYQPSATNSLAIHLTQPPPAQQFTVTPSAGANGSISPATIQTVNPGATLIFTATPDAAYGVAEWLVDGVSVQTGGTSYQLTNITANHTVAVVFGLVTLQASVNDLALSITGLTEYGIPGTPSSGAQRVIQISNTGSGMATGINVAYSGLPPDTTHSSTCGSTLVGGDSCTITIIPGATPSLDNNAIPALCTGGTAPNPGAVQVTADNATTVSTNIVVLGYGCVYQGGYIFAVNDTQGCSGVPSVCTGSIGGTVGALADAPSSLPWDAVAPTATGATSPVAGSSNTDTIFNALTTIQGEPAASYAAGYCHELSSSGFVDWYLPAICEMGNNSGLPGIECSGANMMQNILVNLDDNGVGNLVPNGTYLSSTEDSGNPTTSAWSQSLGAGMTQSTVSKTLNRDVRCVRSF